MTQILPQDDTAAIRKMIVITQALIDMLEDEQRAVAMNDALSFSMTEQDKTKASEQYEAAAAEFLARGKTLRQQADPALFEQLLGVQERLKKAALDNNKKLETIPGLDIANDTQL